MTLIAFAAAFLAGVVLASRFGLPLPALVLFLLASALLGVLLTLVRRSPAPALLLAVVLLGMVRVGTSVDSGLSALAAYQEIPDVEVRGVVVSDPEWAGWATRLRMRVDSIRLDGQWEETSGEILVGVRESLIFWNQRDWPAFRYGDRLSLRGTLEPPPVLEEFDYPGYLARQGIGTVMSFPHVTFLEQDQGVAFYRRLYAARQRMAESLASAVPEPQASLGQALLLGLRDNIPEDLVDDFRATGTSHILAISGLHVGILLGVGLGLSQWLFGRRRQIYLLSPLLLMWLYALISGMSPSVTRAAIMGTVYLTALFFGRPRSVLPALAFAAAVMVAVNPGVIWSVSFQLSFAAMTAIAVLAEPISRRLQYLYERRLGGVRVLPPILVAATYFVAMSVAAIVATLPLVVFYFQEFSLVGLPTTLLVLPALPVVLVSQAATALVGLLSGFWAYPLGSFAWVTTAYVTGVVGLMAQMPGAAVETEHVSSFFVWAYYGVFVAAYAGISFRVQILHWLRSFLKLVHSFRPLRGGVSMWLVVPVVCLAAMLWIAATLLPDSRLRVAFVDVGQGDAVFVATPSGQQIVIDGGPDRQGMVHYLGENLPFWDRTIELVVLTHPHSDHVTGLIEVMRRYKVLRVLERRVEYDTAEYRAWRRAVAEEGAEVVQATSGLTIAVGDGVRAEVLNPPAALLKGTESDVDNASVALRIVFDEVSFLLTGDMFRQAETKVAAFGSRVESDVLKISHHGSRSSSSARFLDTVRPVSAVISVGESNRFGHPHSEVIEELRQRLPQGHLFLTSVRGTVQFVTDGQRLQVKTER